MIQLAGALRLEGRIVTLCCILAWVASVWWWAHCLGCCCSQSNAPMRPVILMILVIEYIWLSFRLELACDCTSERGVEAPRLNVRARFRSI